MRVALDLEDVLVNNVRIFIGKLNQFIEANHNTDKRFSASDIEGWKFDGIRQEFAEIRGWKEDTVEKFMFGDENGWKGFYHITKEVWKEEIEKINPISENMVEQVKKLRKIVKDDGGELYIVTARENVDRLVKQKIEDLGIRELVDGVIIKTKKDRLDFDIYIDDYPKLHQKIEGSVQIMIDQPWNREQDLDKPHRRAKNLAEAVEELQDVGTKV